MAIHPKYQSRKIGSFLTRAALKELPGAKLVLTFTRNPAIVKLVGGICSGLNLNQLSLNRYIPASYTGIEVINGTTYQMKRYSEPLFGTDDPADTENYRKLADTANALAIIGILDRNKL
jgi:hypothetical protein